MGRHDRRGEAVSGTSKAGEMKALWQPELLSNTGSLIGPTLDLITTRRKERCLTGRWRDSETEGEERERQKYIQTARGEDKGEKHRYRPNTW